jgi:hypothetical protein
MCYTCGCKLPYEDHGNPANIIEDGLKSAGAAEDIADISNVKENVLELIRLQQEAGELGNPKKDYN